MSDRGSESAYPIMYHGSSMTIREHLAGQAMQGLLANKQVTDLAAGMEDPMVELIAESAVNYADGLLRELEKGASNEKV